jgi:hypothetical protein
MKYFKNINSYLGIKSVLILLASLILTACGGGNSSTNSDDTTSTRQADLSFNVIAPRSSAAVDDIASLQISVVSQDRQESQEVTLTAENPTVSLRLIPGNYDITVIAYDASGQAISEGTVTLTDVVGGQRYSVSLTLEDILPELIAVITEDAANLTVDELTGQYLLDLTGLNSEASFSLPLSATSSSGAISTYSWSILSGPELAVSRLSSAELFDPEVEQAGQTAAGDSTVLNYFRASEISDGEADSMVVRLTLVDEGGNTVTSDLTIDLLYTDIANALPVAVAGDDFSVQQPPFDPQRSSEFLTINLDGSASYDDDGVVVTYNWTLLSEEELFSNDDETEGSYIAEVYSDFEGNLEFQLEVVDNEGGVSTDTIIVTVTPAPNQAPTAEISMTTASEISTLDGPASLGSNSFDDDGDVEDLVLSWSIVNSAEVGSNVTITEQGPSNIEVSWTEGVFTGDITVQLLVTDIDGATDTDTVTITVTEELPGEEFPGNDFPGNDFPGNEIPGEDLP